MALTPALMGGGPGAPGGAPPPMGGPPGAPPGGAPGGTGAATMPSPMGGAASQGISAVKVALEALQKALPSIPMGSDLHTAVLKSVTDLSKHIGAGEQGGADTMQQLTAMARQHQANPQQAQMQRMMPPGGAGQPPPPPAGA